MARLTKHCSKGCGYTIYGPDRYVRAEIEEHETKCNGPKVQPQFPGGFLAPRPLQDP